ncbi:carbohydrate ABC transporter permease [Paenibacillus nasutitermitis]|uniref:Sugar ABC transporter permease n=1 Tax=Paenibacillus nasutitermitis TaxID=1652958 RepID=A0A916ZCQ6_9BACL|nr:carbohydrate ABC transporter permease [Paenibacillus nasutitermitis]GGD88575.1 sugar ABC transporter permease [Paenibacillus nasutitermitis]
MTNRISVTSINALFAGLVLVSVAPFIYMLLTSFRHTYVLDFSFDFKEMDFQNYITIFRNYSFLDYFWNSLFVVTAACVFNTIISSLAGYAFAKKSFPGKEAIFWVYIATMIVPAQVTLIPTFMIMRELHLLNNLIALFLPVINAFGVFLCRQFMKDGIPDELIEAAKIDGCKELKIFTTIVIPLAKPVLVSLAVFTFITTWNDFIWPLIIITDSAKQTLTLALSTLQGSYATNYGLVTAGATLTFLPPFIFYMFMQKQFVEGIAFSGIKG